MTMIHIANVKINTKGSMDSADSMFNRLDLETEDKGAEEEDFSEVEFEEDSEKGWDEESWGDEEAWDDEGGNDES